MDGEIRKKGTWTERVEKKYVQEKNKEKEIKVQNINNDTGKKRQEKKGSTVEMSPCIEQKMGGKNVCQKGDQ